MHELYAPICMEIAINQYMTLGEIQAKFEGKEKTVKRRLDELVKIGRLDYSRITGQRGKRKKYSFPENEKKDNLWTHVWQEKEKRLFINYLSQRKLSSFISQQNKLYGKELKKLKDDSDESFFDYHLASLCSTLEWISKLTWAINSGILDDSKIELATRNKERFEESLQKIVFNMKKRNIDRAKTIAFQVYELLDSLPLISAFFSLKPEYKDMLIKRY